MSNLVAIPFHQTQIIATDDQHIALKAVCDAMRIDWSAQYRRLRRTSWATVAMTTTVASDGKPRDMVTIDRRTFTMWLATINTTRLDDEGARQLVELFQKEAADVLDRYFHEGGAINPQATEHQLNALVRRSQMQMELCQAAVGLIQPDHLEAKARVVLARGLGEHAELDASRRPLYTSDFLKSKNLSAKRMQRVAGMFGKRVKKAYIERHGTEPGVYPLDLANGQVRNVCAYTEADRDLLEQVWMEHFEPQGVLAA